MNIRLIPTWRYAWKWFSVQAAAAVVIISVIRDVAQQLVATNPSLDFIAHAHWYPPTMAGLGLLAVLLRLVHQPVDVSAAPSADLFDRIAAAIPLPGPGQTPSVAPPTPPKGDPMNRVFSSIFEAIPAIVVQAETTITGTGAGADKAASVMGIVAHAIDPGDSAGLARARQIMELSVWALKVFGPLIAGAISGSATKPAADARAVGSAT